MSPKLEGPRGPDTLINVIPAIIAGRIGHGAAILLHEAREGIMTNSNLGLPVIQRL